MDRKHWHRVARKLCRDGFNDEEIATAIGLTKSSIQTVTRWVRANEGIVRASGVSVARKRERLRKDEEGDVVAMMDAPKSSKQISYWNSDDE